LVILCLCIVQVFGQTNFLYATVGWCDKFNRGWLAVITVQPNSGQFSILHTFGGTDYVIPCLSSQEEIPTAYDHFTHQITYQIYIEERSMVIDYATGELMFDNLVDTQIPWNGMSFENSNIIGTSARGNGSSWCSNGCLLFGSSPVPEGGLVGISSLPYTDETSYPAFYPNPAGQGAGVYVTQFHGGLNSDTCDNAGHAFVACLTAIDARTGAMLSTVPLINDMVWLTPNFINNNTVLGVGVATPGMCNGPQQNKYSAYSTIIATGQQRVIGSGCLPTVGGDPYFRRGVFSYDGSHFLASAVASGSNPQPWIVLYDLYNNIVKLNTRLTGLGAKLGGVNDTALTLWSVDFL